MHWVLVLITPLRHHGKSHQYQAILKWPKLKTNNGNQTPNVSVVFPRVSKWRVFHMKLCSVHSILPLSRTPSVFPSSPPFSPSFLPSWTLSICSMCDVFPLFPAECPVKAAGMVPFETTPSPPSGIAGIPCEQPHKVWAQNLLLKRLPHLWQNPKYMIAFGKEVPTFFLWKWRKEKLK